MALDAVVYPQDNFGADNGEHGFVLQEDHDTFLYGFWENNIDQKGIHGNWDYNYNSSSSSLMQLNSIKNQCDPNSSPEVSASPIVESLPPVTTTTTTTTRSGRKKRRRTKSFKNKEELEKQRMTHIAVERNRRKQMNEYLAIIRSLMPASYAQRGDQASIVGGAINFVKELEKKLQTLEAQQQPKNESSQLFNNFFTFPQYSTTRSTHSTNSSSGMVNEKAMADTRNALAEIEVTVVERYANLKILSKTRPKQLLKIVMGLQYLWLTILHLNITTVDHMVLYTLSLKLEDGCQITTVNEIADAVKDLFGKIEEESAFKEELL